MRANRGERADKMGMRWREARMTSKPLGQQSFAVEDPQGQGIVCERKAERESTSA
jgi:hypothetical protein